MRVWLLKTGEPVPLGATAKDKPHRVGLLSRKLAERGHQTIWWTSTFDRVTRRNAFAEDMSFSPQEGLVIRMLHSPGYIKSISLARIRDQQIIAQKFFEAAHQETLPDVIVCAWPTVELCSASVKFGKKFGIPVILDMRDMWPDILVDSVPAIMRPFVRLFLWRMFHDARYACENATAITGITDAFVDWGVNRAGRARTEQDRSFPLAAPAVQPTVEQIKEAEDYWDSLGVTNREGVFRTCYIGTLGYHTTVEALLSAARAVDGSEMPMQFVICGSGDNLENFRNIAKSLTNVIFPGWIDYAKMYVLMRRCAVGVDMLIDRYDYLSSINNKAIEYLSAGLPVISSPPRGVLHKLLQTEKCGMSHNAETLASVLTSLAQDKAALRAMADNSRRTYEQYFNAEKVYAAMVDYLESMAGARQNAEGRNPC